MSCTEKKSPLLKVYKLNKEFWSSVDNCPNGFDVCKDLIDNVHSEYRLCLPKTYNKADYCHNVIAVIAPQKTEPRYKLVRSRIAECIPPWPPGCLCGSAAITVRQNIQYHMIQLHKFYVNKSIVCDGVGKPILNNIQNIESLDFVSLQNNTLHSIPFYLFSSQTFIKILDLSNNRIKTLDHDMGDNLSMLKVLDLSVNILNAVPSGAFRGIEDVCFLFLGINQIRTIKGDIFANLSVLSHLDLSHNHIHMIEQLLFSHLPSIKSIDLSHNILPSLLDRKSVV
jgi:hypothetical protein